MVVLMRLELYFLHIYQGDSVNQRCLEQRKLKLHTFLFNTETLQVTPLLPVTHNASVLYMESVSLPLKVFFLLDHPAEPHDHQLLLFWSAAENRECLT